MTCDRLRLIETFNVGRDTSIHQTHAHTHTRRKHAYISPSLYHTNPHTHTHIYTDIHTSTRAHTQSSQRSKRESLELQQLFAMHKGSAVDFFNAVIALIDTRKSGSDIIRANKVASSWEGIYDIAEALWEQGWVGPQCKDRTGNAVWCCRLRLANGHTHKEYQY